MVDDSVKWVTAIRLYGFLYPLASIKQTEWSPITNGFKSPCILGVMICYDLKLGISLDELDEF